MYKTFAIIFLALTPLASAEVSKQNLENAMKQLSDKDKAVLEQIQNQVINWPESVFKEVQAYRNFIINARKQAEAMQASLSNEAQEAIKIEQEFKTKLSPEAIKILSNIEVQK